MDHQRIRSRSAFLAVAAALLLQPACGLGPPGGGEGEVEVALLALNVSEVASVTVTITGPDIGSPIVVPLVKSGTRWGGTLSGIPAGSDRSFALSARNAAGSEIYRGQVDGITITPGHTALVTINAQQATPTTPKLNVAPSIDALVASATTVAPGEVVSLAVTAHDANVGDTLSYQWAVPALDGGTLSAPAAAATSWTAPAVDTTCPLTITVSDPGHATATMSVAISVKTGHGRGKATVTTTLNTWPVVEQITAQPTPIDRGQTATLDVVASDADGDTLAYAWSCDCDGSFSNPTVKSPSFTLATVPAGKSCTFTVGVADGKGGSHSGSLTVSAGPAPDVDLPPEIVSAYQSSDQAPAQGTVTLRVVAVDPNGTAVSFVWSETPPAQGTFGTPNTTSTSSEVVWTASATFAATATLKATITDATGQKTEVPFTVDAVLAPWTQLLPAGALPPARGNGASSAVGYDQAGNRLIFFGGQATGGGLLNDTWVLTGADGTAGTPQWLALATVNTPAPHRHHAAAYDRINNRLIVYGGCLGQCTPLDSNVYVLSNANGLGGTPTWQTLSPGGTSPPLRDDHSAVYDPGSNRLMVFGGDNCCGGRFADTWLLSYANGLGGAPVWSQLVPSGGTPPPRAAHRAGYDELNNRMIVYGGNASGAELGDTWVLLNANGIGGGATWQQIVPSGALPTARTSTTFAYDSTSERILVFGGYGGGGFLADAWSLSHANGVSGTPVWTRLLTSLDAPAPTGPGGRTSPLTGYNSTSHQLIVFGGDNAGGKFNDTWVLPF
jgi:hypothetical protein